MTSSPSDDSALKDHDKEATMRCYFEDETEDESLKKLLLPIDKSSSWREPRRFYWGFFFLLGDILPLAMAIASIDAWARFITPGLAFIRPFVARDNEYLGFELCLLLPLFFILQAIAILPSYILMTPAVAWFSVRDLLVILETLEAHDAILSEKKIQELEAARDTAHRNHMLYFRYAVLIHVIEKAIHRQGALAGSTETSEMEETMSLDNEVEPQLRTTDEPYSFLWPKGGVYDYHFISAMSIDVYHSYILVAIMPISMAYHVFFAWVNACPEFYLTALIEACVCMQLRFYNYFGSRAYLDRYCLLFFASNGIPSDATIKTLEAGRKQFQDVLFVEHGLNKKIMFMLKTIAERVERRNRRQKRDANV